MGLKTKITLNFISGGSIVCGTIGTASAKSDCIEGKYYEADYWVFGIGLNAGIDIPKAVGKVLGIAGKIGSNLKSLLSGASFFIDQNYPPGYLSYLDIEGHGASFVHTGTLVDIEVGTYKGGRKDIKAASKSKTGNIGLQIFKFEGIHLIRKDKPKENCCEG